MRAGLLVALATSTALAAPAEHGKRRIQSLLELGDEDARPAATRVAGILDEELSNARTYDVVALGKVIDPPPAKKPEPRGKHAAKPPEPDPLALLVEEFSRTQLSPVGQQIGAKLTLDRVFLAHIDSRDLRARVELSLFDFSSGKRLAHETVSAIADGSDADNLGDEVRDLARRLLAQVDGPIEKPRTTEAKEVTPKPEPEAEAKPVVRLEVIQKVKPPEEKKKERKKGGDPLKDVDGTEDW